MDKQKRLVKTQKALQHCVDKAEHALSWTMQKCHDKQASIESLQDYQLHYQQTLQTQAQQGINARQLQQLDGFIHQLQTAVDTEQQQLTALQQMARERQAKLTTEQTKKIAVDNLSLKYQHHQQALDEKAAQAEVDDLSIIHAKRDQA